MNNFLRFCSIVSIIIASIKLAMIGNLNHVTVMFIIMSGLVILLGNRTLYIITASIAALVLFIKVNGENNAAIESTLLQIILILSFFCFGLYLIIRGIFPSNRRRRRDQ